MRFPLTAGQPNLPGIGFHVCAQWIACGMAMLLPSVVWADAPNQRFVRVNGTAVAKVSPDVVVWHLQITHTDPNVENARRANDAQVKAVLAIARELKVKPQAVQTGRLAIEKVFQRDRSGNQGEFRFYKVERTVILRMENLNTFDATLEKLTVIDGVRLSYTLESSKFHEIRFETRLEAARVAKRKAAAMVELLGGKLGEVLSIDETADESARPWSSPMTNAAYFAGPPTAVPDGVSGTFAPGAIEIRVSVQVTFKIE